MKIRYFPDTDTLYIELADRVSSSSEPAGGLEVNRGRNQTGLMLRATAHGLET